MESWQLHHRAKLTQTLCELLSWCLQVVEETEAHSKQHVDDAQNYRHLHLERVQEGQFVGGDVPDLHT